jgi:hypothetical protein
VKWNITKNLGGSGYILTWLWAGSCPSPPNVRNFIVHLYDLLIMQEDTGRREKRCGGKGRTEKSVIYSIVISYIECTIVIRVMINVN